MVDADLQHPVPDLLGRDYWLVWSTPAPTTSAADIEALAPAHIEWLLGLEAAGALFLSGPLVEGEGVRVGTGVTILRADNAEAAAATALQDPFVLAGLRTPSVFRWRVNEGSVGVTVSLGTGTFLWT